MRAGPGLERGDAEGAPEPRVFCFCFFFCFFSSFALVPVLDPLPPGLSSRPFLRPYPRGRRGAARASGRRGRLLRVGGPPGAGSWRDARPWRRRIACTSSGLACAPTRCGSGPCALRGRQAGGHPIRPARPEDRSAKPPRTRPRLRARAATRLCRVRLSSSRAPVIAPLNGLSVTLFPRTKGLLRGGTRFTRGRRRRGRRGC